MENDATNEMISVFALGGDSSDNGVQKPMRGGIIGFQPLSGCFRRIGGSRAREFNERFSFLVHG
jgi:hypothetical protein